MSLRPHRPLSLPGQDALGPLVMWLPALSLLSGLVPVGQSLVSAILREVQRADSGSALCLLLFWILSLMTVPQVEHLSFGWGEWVAPFFFFYVFYFGIFITLPHFEFTVPKTSKPFSHLLL